jgi:hypothetical protein
MNVQFLGNLCKRDMIGRRPRPMMWAEEAKKGGPSVAVPNLALFEENEYHAGIETHDCQEWFPCRGHHDKFADKSVEDRGATAGVYCGSCCCGDLSTSSAGATPGDAGYRVSILWYAGGGDRETQPSGPRGWRHLRGFARGSFFKLSASFGPS